MQKTTKQIKNFKLQEIHMRDPYILTDTSDKTYYLYGTTSVCNGAADIDPYFEVWSSKDLVNFEGPYAAFKPEKGFWGVKDYWAPEVHEYKGKYYMFASFKGGIGENRGTAILKADSPAGPFYEWSNGPVTLKGHECLDGTLYVDPSGKPWIVYCLEWTSAYFGKIMALPLAEDLRNAENQNPITIVDTELDILPWIRHMSDPRVEKIGYLTDAPFLHRNPDGSLVLLWSSYSIPKWNRTGQGGYVVARCISKSGDINGPWSHDLSMLLDENAGHCGVFRDLNGELRLVCHCNDTEHGSEYPVIYKLIQNNDNISISRSERKDD